MDTVDGAHRPSAVGEGSAWPGDGNDAASEAGAGDAGAEHVGRLLEPCHELIDRSSRDLVVVAQAGVAGQEQRAEGIDGAGA